MTTTEHTRVALFALPKSDQLALLGLADDATKADVETAIESRARAEAAQNFPPMKGFDDLSADDRSALARAARTEAGKTGRPSLGTARPEYAEKLDHEAAVAERDLPSLRHDLSVNHLALQDSERRLRDQGGALVLNRERRRALKARLGVLALGALELLFATVLAFSVCGLASYPDLSYVPPTILVTMGAVTAAIVLLSVGGPIYIVRQLGKHSWSPLALRATAVVGAAAMLAGLGAVLALRAAVAVHAGHDAADLILATVSAMASAATAVFVGEIHKSGHAAALSVAEIEGKTAANEAARADLRRERARLEERAAKLLTEIEAPVEARLAFEVAVLAAREEERVLDLQIGERVRAGAAAFEKLQSLSPAERQFVKASLFRIVDAEDRSALTGEA